LDIGYLETKNKTSEKMYNSTEFIKKLVCPDNPRLPLEYDKNLDCFISGEGHKYNIINNIPVLLPSNFRDIKLQSEIHKELDTNFSYIVHYQSDASIFNYFESISGEEAHETNRLHNRIIKNIPNNCKSILDVGCGNGWVAEYFCKKGLEVISMDVALVNPQKVLEKCAFSNHTAITADVYHLPFVDNSLNCIIASEIIEHVPDPKLFICKLYDALSGSGKLIITTPFNEKIKYHLCIHCNKPTPSNAHIHSFNKKKIAIYLNELGITNYSINIFSSKILNKFRSFYIFRYVPYPIWNCMDRLFCSIFGKEQRMIISIEKMV
jgi:2-polyprenyl-3-methyl-5-hydroxy-6-metoxy-1,4-benzoquinol methylase